MQKNAFFKVIFKQPGVIAYKMFPLLKTGGRRKRIVSPSNLDDSTRSCKSVQWTC